jgi:hypothetical protein
MEDRHTCRSKRQRQDHRRPEGATQDSLAPHPGHHARHDDHMRISPTQYEDNGEAEADAKFRSDHADAAHRAFERTAAELAGPDQTLRRVLLARLDEAYHRGRTLEAEAFYAEVRRRHAWVDAHPA